MLKIPRTILGLFGVILIIDQAMGYFFDFEITNLSFSTGNGTVDVFPTIIGIILISIYIFNIKVDSK